MGKATINFRFGLQDYQKIYGKRTLNFTLNKFAYKIKDYLQHNHQYTKYTLSNTQHYRRILNGSKNSELLAPKKSDIGRNADAD